MICLSNLIPSRVAGMGSFFFCCLKDQKGRKTWRVNVYSKRTSLLEFKRKKIPVREALNLSSCPEDDNGEGEGEDISFELSQHAGRPLAADGWWGSGL